MGGKADSLVLLEGALKQSLQKLPKDPMTEAKWLKFLGDSTPNGTFIVSLLIRYYHCVLANFIVH